MRAKRSIIGLILITCLITQACGDDQRRSIAKASDDMARGLSIAFDLDAELINEKLISNDEAILITSSLLDVNRIVKEFNTKAASFSKIDAPAKQALLIIAGDLTNSIAKLNSQGILRIKNQEAQIKFKTAIVLMQSAVAVLSGVLAKQN